MVLSGLFMADFLQKLVFYCLLRSFIIHQYETFISKMDNSVNPFCWIQR